MLHVFAVFLNLDLLFTYVLIFVTKETSSSVNGAKYLQLRNTSPHTGKLVYFMS